MNNVVMYDRETDSLWSQFLGKAVEGRYKGEQLRLLASQVVSWALWRAEYPDTLVLDTGPFSTGPLGWTTDAYKDYYFDGTAGITGETHADTRLSRKHIVLGVTGESSQRAYAEGFLPGLSVLNDTFEETPLVVAWDSRSGAAGVHERSVGDTTLTFDMAPEANLMVDRETGSTWSRVTGESLGGTLLGKRLTPVRFIRAFWFSWTDFHPDTELYGLDTD